MPLFPGEQLIFAEVVFAGSFQCRLATDPDPSDCSPTFPNKEMWGDGYAGTLYGKGGTFAYDEKRFDRVIRLSNPVQLRSCLVDPWSDTTVTQVRFQTTQRGDAVFDEVTSLNGTTVALGNENPTPDNPGPMFSDNKADGGRRGWDALLNLHFNIGGIVEAWPKGIPAISCFGNNPSWAAGRDLVKRAKFRADKIGMHLQRKKWIEEHEDGPGDFIYYGIFNRIFISRIQFNGDAGIVSLMGKVPNAQWRLAMAFCRWDRDTLTGKLDGSLLGYDPSCFGDLDAILRPGMFGDRWPTLDILPNNQDW